MRRSVRDGRSFKEQANFDNLEDAKAFRMGQIEKTVANGIHRTVIKAEDGMTFAGLVDEWKTFHFLRIDYATRHSFDKELDLIKVILNFYRRRKNPRFVIPIFAEHYLAAKVKRDATQPVRSLRPDDLGRFFQALKERENPLYYPLALTQFCLGLRIGEVCGLHWKDVDLEHGRVKIESTIVWDHENWEPRIKARPKNGRARIMAMPDTLVKELQRLKEQRDPKVELVFHAGGQPLIRKSIGQAYNRSLKLIGFDYVSGTHLLRKTSATQANRVTGDFYAVSRLLDHATPDVTMRYVEEVDDSKRKVAQSLDDVVQSVIKRELETRPK